VRGQGFQHCLLKKFGIVALALVSRALGGEKEGVGEVAIGAGVIFGICCTGGGELGVIYSLVLKSNAAKAFLGAPSGE